MNKPRSACRSIFPALLVVLLALGTAAVAQESPAHPAEVRTEAPARLERMPDALFGLAAFVLLALGWAVNSSARSR